MQSVCRVMEANSEYKVEDVADGGVDRVGSKGVENEIVAK